MIRDVPSRCRLRRRTQDLVVIDQVVENRAGGGTKPLLSLRHCDVIETTAGRMVSGVPRRTDVMNGLQVRADRIEARCLSERLDEVAVVRLVVDAAPNLFSPSDGPYRK